MSMLESHTVFAALTRPQMFAGVTYNLFIANSILAVELFLIFKSLWVLAVAMLFHGVAMVFCLREPRFFDLWIVRVRQCPRIANHKLWGCNSYRP